MKTLTVQDLKHAVLARDNLIRLAFLIGEKGSVTLSGREIARLAYQEHIPDAVATEASQDAELAERGIAMRAAHADLIARG
jgi:hypothetical protein